MRLEFRFDFCRYCGLLATIAATRKSLRRRDWCTIVIVGASGVIVNCDLVVGTSRSEIKNGTGYKEFGCEWLITLHAGFP